MSASPPLRFLAVVLGGWAALRTALVAPPWSTPPADAAAAAVPSRPFPPPGGSRNAARPPLSKPPPSSARATLAIAIRPAMGSPRPAPSSGPSAATDVSAPLGSLPGATPARVSPLPAPLAQSPGPGAVRISPGRWSLSAWAFVRQGDSAPLAAGGLIGGSQAGARLTYRLNRDSGRPLALSLRLSAPLGPAGGGEAALGLGWKPVRGLPAYLLAERRQALGKGGRSAFAVTAYGGVVDSPAGPFRIDGYAQAGIVGARSRDLFGDGSIRISLPIGERFRIGAGAWAAAQPGIARLDVGPQAALRVRVADRALTVAADWRVRVSGNARPGSGPTLTLATDF